MDSSFLLATLAENDVRVLAVHVDNGWNSNLAVANIQKLLVASGFDLYTVVLELKHFYDLQRAFLLASVPDLEIPTDHAIQASLWAVAEKFDVPTIVSGMNFATESSANQNWAYGHSDWTYISAIWERFGNPEADFPVLVHPSAFVSPSARLEEGSVVLAQAHVGPGAAIEAGALLNSGASLDHESIMRRFSSLGPGAFTAGGVELGERAMVGLGASLFQKVSLGADTVIGASSMVRHDVPANSVAFGTPSQVIRTRKIDDPYL